MSKIAYCPRGGMEGILLKSSERKVKNNTEVIDLPYNQIYIERCTNDHSTMEHAKYWEDEKTGSHGWACSACGMILQWG